MKILFIAVFSPTSTNNSQSRGFKKIGNTVIEYNYREKLKEFNIDINPSYAHKKRDQDIINTCVDNKPDLVLFSKCNNVSIDVIKECNKYSKTALWFMDYIYTLDNELKEKIKYCNYNFISRHGSYEIAKEINPSSYLIPEGFDEDNNIYIPDLPKIYNVSFIGSLNGIGCHFDRLDYYEKFKFNIFNNVYNKEHSKVVCQSKINLNFTEGDGTSDRLYKLMASKGFVLTQPYINIEKEFTIGEDLDVFIDESDLNQKLDYYINNDIERERIAENGYNIVQNYSRLNWAKSIIDKIKD